jgi:hypothetical protein
VFFWWGGDAHKKQQQKKADPAIEQGSAGVGVALELGD